MRQAMPRSYEPEQTFLFRLIQVKASYGISPNWRGTEKGLSETFHPAFIAERIAPKRCAGRKTEIVLIGKRELQDPARQQAISGMGRLTLRGKTNQFLGAMPMDMLSHLIVGAAQGMYRFITMMGTPLANGHSEISSCYFEWDYEPEDHGL